MKTGLFRSATALAALLTGLALVAPDLALAQSSPFMTGATALQTNILAWLTPVAVILVMVLGAMAMANRMASNLASRAKDGIRTRRRTRVCVQPVLVLTDYCTNRG
jgi:uncharacterized membrane protein YidH (DUF202 family)